ncbi:unnamed protein product, partial [Polarella glacialis]
MVQEDPPDLETSPQQEEALAQEGDAAAAERRRKQRPPVVRGREKWNTGHQTWGTAWQPGFPTDRQLCRE